MTIDSHTHAWGAPDRDHPWVNGPLIESYLADFSVDPVYPAESLLADMDAAGIDEAVVVGYPIYEWTDNAYTARAVEEHDRLYGVVMIDQFADDADETLRDLMSVDGVLGFRLGAICPYDRMWETFDPTVSWLADAVGETAFFEAARETDAVVQVLAHVEQLDQVVELVETYPDLTYLLDHFGHADPTVAPEAGPFARFRELAAHDSVAVKISEIVHRSNEGFPYADMHDHVRWFLEEFGRERVVWGSDFPNVSDEASYAESLDWLEHVDGLSNADRRWIRGRAFERHVGLE
jgi:predicted TIM-barrel fold metal-dependent hydrolase